MRDNNRVVMFRRVSTFLLVLGLAGVGQATDAPVAVSPGAVSRLALVEGRCPTFSWGAVSAATSYELVVYRVEEEKKETEPVLQQAIVGSASSWTPALERCLERGGQYGWSVRAVEPEGKSRWSTPSLFQVVSGPSESAVEEAIAIVRRHFGSPSQGPVSEPNVSRDASPTLSTGSPAGESPASLAPPGTQMSVDGNLDAASFSGDGAMLTSLNPNNLSSPVPVLRGGTGGFTASQARSNLGVVSDGELNQHSNNQNAHHSRPTSLPPSGPAGGSFTGTFPNPVITANTVRSGHIVDGSIEPQDLGFDPAFIKGWARIGSAGEVLGSYNCDDDPEKTGQDGPGIYYVDFSPIAMDISTRPSIAVVNGGGNTTIGVEADGTDRIRVLTSANTAFTVAVF